MKTLKYIFIPVLTTALLLSCDTDYIDNPDNPIVAPSNQLMNNAQFDLAYELNDQWTAGRGTLGFAQYWAETFYTNENRYSIRTTQVDDFWEWPYRILSDLKKVIELNEDPETMENMAVFGDNNNQVQASRILMAFTFSKLVDLFGDIPYWSYGQQNDSFQALQLEDGINSPEYASAEEIYNDIFNELLDAANKMNTSEVVFISGDNIYNGDAAKWIKFAHSIRLRLAIHISRQNPTLAQTIYNESDSEAFTSNDDNATLTFGNDDLTGGPWHQAFTVGARRDFGPSLSFIDLLYNRTGPFSTLTDKDPRVDEFFDTREETAEVVGLPYGFGNATARAVEDEGIPDANIIKADFTQPLLTYSEIEFIRSEFDGWDQTHYLNGVDASMQYWGINSGDISAYIDDLPAASEENVLTQKYIALYMDGLEGWTEYRRTGFPNTLTVPGDTFGTPPNEVTFITLVPGLNEIPKRITYPQKEQLLNNSNWQDAKNNLDNGDEMFSTIFWDVN
jgi:hypothetical protein